MVADSPKNEIARQVLAEIAKGDFCETYAASAGRLGKAMRIFYAPSFARQVEKFRDNSKFLQDFGKLHDSLKQGYQGGSKGGINGILNICKTNRVLLKDYAREADQNADYLHSLGLSSTDSERCKAIKVVAHVPSGNRLIGALYDQGERYDVVIFAVSNYRGKPAY